MKTELQKDIELHDEIKKFEKTKNWSLYKDHEKREIAFLAGYKYAKIKLKNFSERGETNNPPGQETPKDKYWPNKIEGLIDNLRFRIEALEKASLLNPNAETEPPDPLLSDVLADDLKCCGNCKHYDVIDDCGSVCYFNNSNEGYPVEHASICDDWEYDESIKNDRIE